MANQVSRHLFLKQKVSRIFFAQKKKKKFHAISWFPPIIFISTFLFIFSKFLSDFFGQSLYLRKVYDVSQPIHDNIQKEKLNKKREEKLMTVRF